MKRAGLVVLWVVASFATALVAWSAVQVAGDQVAERPVRPLSADEVAALAPPTVPPPTAPAETTTVVPPTTVPVPTTPAVLSSTTLAAIGTTTPTSRPPAATPTSRPPPPVSTTATTAATTGTTRASTSTSTSTSTTTTTTTVAPTVTAYQLAGGSVVISSTPGQVSLVSASPRAGYSMEIDASGPEEVRVEFDGETESKFRAKWENGRLGVDIEDD